MGHKSKKHKKDLQCGLSKNVKLPCDIEQECQEQIPLKKKNKFRGVCVEEDGDPPQENAVKKKSKKRKMDKDPEDVDNTPTTEVHPVGQEEEAICKKSKKSSNIEHGEKEDGDTDDLETINIDEAHLRKRKKAKRTKEKQSSPSLTLCQDGLQETGDACQLFKKKKKKSRELSNENPSNDINESPHYEDDQERPAKKRKKKHKKTLENQDKSCSDNPLMKKKKKEKREEMKDETQRIDENEGKTLQENGTLGQWATAGFESSARQNKFFRLLGGHKKDVNQVKKLFGNMNTGKKLLFGSLSQAKTHANFAMSLEQQKKFESDMDREYEKAIGLKFNHLKSGGLGYVKPPAEGKKFYIDTNKSNSVKFDD